MTDDVVAMTCEAHHHRFLRDGEYAIAGLPPARRVLPWGAVRDAVLVLGLCACGTTSSEPEPEPNATLADLGPIHLVVGIGGTDEQGRSGVDVEVAYNSRAFRDQHGYCATLAPSLTGTINGVALTLVDQGREVHDPLTCYPPRLHVSQAAISGVATVDVADDALAIHAEYPADAFELRVATLRSPDAWAFHVGQEVVAGWSHPGDRLVSGNKNYPIYFRVEGVQYALRIVPFITGDEVRFTIPPPGMYTGDGLMSFNFSSTEGQATTCSGAERCDYFAYHQFMHAARIDP